MVATVIRRSEYAKAPSVYVLPRKVEHLAVSIGYGVGGHQLVVRLLDCITSNFDAISAFVLSRDYTVGIDFNRVRTSIFRIHRKRIAVAVVVHRGMLASSDMHFIADNIGIDVQDYRILGIFHLDGFFVAPDCLRVVQADFSCILVDVDVFVARVVITISASATDATPRRYGIDAELQLPASVIGLQSVKFAVVNEYA